jgi:hypothetical protein
MLSTDGMMMAFFRGLNLDKLILLGMTVWLLIGLALGGCEHRIPTEQLFEVKAEMQGGVAP